MIQANLKDAVSEYNTNNANPKKSNFSNNMLFFHHCMFDDPKTTEGPRRAIDTKQDVLRK